MSVFFDSVNGSKHFYDFFVRTSFESVNRRHFKCKTCHREVVRRVSTDSVSEPGGPRGPDHFFLQLYP